MLKPDQTGGGKKKKFQCLRPLSSIPKSLLAVSSVLSFHP